MIRIALAADHGGFVLKEVLKSYLSGLGDIEIDDLGAFAYDEQDDYPDLAFLAARSVSLQKTPKAIIVCGSGVGACVAANKVKGVRASVCHDTYSARQGVEHDDMNVLCLGGRVVGVEVAKEIARTFCRAVFSGEKRHQTRLDKVLAQEKKGI